MVYNDDQASRNYRRQKAQQKRDQEEIDEACKALLSVPRGRKYLWWLLQIGRVGTQPFSANALQTSFACGELNVGNQILAHIISVDPAGYVRMMQEQADASAQRDPNTDEPDGDADAGAASVDDSDAG